ncbi:hypothetical protein [Leucobacter sp.]
MTLALTAPSASPIIFAEIHDPRGKIPQLVLVQLMTWIAMIMSRLVNEDAQAEVLLANLEETIALSQRAAEHRGHAYTQPRGLGKRMRHTAWFWLLPQG